jgi:hypothetical protein
LQVQYVGQDYTTYAGSRLRRLALIKLIQVSYVRAKYYTTYAGQHRE